MNKRNDDSSSENEKFKLDRKTGYVIIDGKRYLQFDDFLIEVDNSNDK